MMERGISLIKPSALVNVAAVAVIVASVAAVGAIFGIIPAVHSERAESLPVQQRAEAGAGDADAHGVPPSGEAGERAMKGRTVLAAVNGCANCGVIEAVTAVRVQGQGTGVGAVAGGVAGAAVGSQWWDRAMAGLRSASSVRWVVPMPVTPSNGMSDRTRVIASRCGWTMAPSATVYPFRQHRPSPSARRCAWWNGTIAAQG
ncbi:MAG: hypothetical protein MZV65_44580 [Chromatiales bacterium]|nr:hypothetical protein [Chromatiales bacterium]